MYVRWDLPSAQPAFTSLAAELGLGFYFTQSLAVSWLIRNLRVRPVFVEHHNGLPLGQVLAAVCSSRARAMALVVQSLGEA